MWFVCSIVFVFSGRRRHTRCALVTGVQTCALPILSAVDRERWTIEAPAAVFHDQDDVLRAFKAGELERDVVVVVRFQGPRANGMPELHKLTPALGVLQDRGFRVAPVTDGRMSGARSEESRVGEGWVRQGRSGECPDHLK